MVPRPLLDTQSALADFPLASGELDSPALRLSSAATRLVALEGMAAASARAIAAAAGAAPSAINYNFGSIERLLLSAFARGEAETADWLALRRAEILALPRDPAGAAMALNHVLAVWTGPSRPLALLYQERLAAGAEGGWTALWRDFWLDQAAIFGLSPAQGRLMHLFFESEALYHLSSWSPALERAALLEMNGHFAATWLGAPPYGDQGFTALAESTAGARPHGSLAPAALRIAEAAAEVVEAAGLTGLTHRAVAHHAGVSTGSVTHHFRRAEDLVAGAIRGQVQTMHRDAAEPRTPVDAVQTAAQFRDALQHHARQETTGHPSRRRRRLFLATVRRPDLAAAGAVIRFSHGGTTKQILSRLTGLPADRLALPSGVLSRLLSALWVATMDEADPLAARLRLVEDIQAGLDLA